MTHYLQKQLSIFIVFFTILLAIGVGVFLLFNPNRGANCYDGVRNQGEEKIDCGGPCGPCPAPRQPKIISQNSILTIENNYDLIAEIRNVNRDWGIELVNYKFNLYNDDGQQIGFREGATYLLPEETKYIIEQKIYLQDEPASMVLDLQNISWQGLKDFSELQFRVRNAGYQVVDGKYRLTGNIENKTNYNLDTVEIIGLLFDNNQNIIAVGKTTINTFMIAEMRSFVIEWPYQTEKGVANYDVKVYTNVFQDDNFMKVHATPEKFKEH